MLRVGERHQRQGTVQSWNLLVFSVGGRRLAVKTLEVAGISQWEIDIPVAGRTPYISTVIRQDQVVLPVFDLAALLHLSVQGCNPLCLRVKHPLGDMAVRIDEDMPVLHTLDPAGVQIYRGKDIPADGSYTSGPDEIPILSVSRFGSNV
jgi:CheW-like domain